MDKSDCNCGICEILISRQENAVNCDGKCKKIFHSKCVEISNKDYQLIQKCNGAKWFCEKCLLYLELALDMQNQIEELKNHVSKELQSFKQILNKHDSNSKDECLTEKHSYAKVAASSEVVIIKPKAKQESKKTIEALQKNLKPAALEVGITAVRNIKEGGVVIQCKSKEEQEKIKKAAEKKLIKNYEIKAPELKNPRIKIVDIKDNLEAADLLNCIMKQNTFLQNVENMAIQLITIKKMRKNYMAIVECDPLVYQKIMTEGCLCINWSRCRVFEYISVFRCFKCAGFDHNAEKCSSEQRCLNCASSDHVTESCENEMVKCVNCIQSNSKYNLGLDVHHKAYDTICPVYLKKVEIQRQKIKQLKEE